jgi:hypothetical protein
MTLGCVGLDRGGFAVLRFDNNKINNDSDKLSPVTKAHAACPVSGHGRALVLVSVCV